MEEEIERRFKDLEATIQRLDKQVQDLERRIDPEEISRAVWEKFKDDIIRRGIR